MNPLISTIKKYCDKYLYFMKNACDVHRILFAILLKRILLEIHI